MMNDQNTDPEIAIVVQTSEGLQTEIAAEEAILTGSEHKEEVDIPIEITSEASDKADLEKVFDLDVDFENYSVTEKRANLIRDQLTAIKAKAWLASLCDWISAEGQVYYPYGEQTQMGEAPQKRIAWEPEHALHTLEVIYDGLDTELRIEGKKFLSLQKLPKGDEILLSHYNPSLTSKFNTLEVELHANLKVFTKAKADKQKAFQERFKKGT